MKERNKMIEGLLDAVISSGEVPGVRTNEGYAPRTEGYAPRLDGYTPRTEGYAPRVEGGGLMGALLGEGNIGDSYFSGGDKQDSIWPNYEGQYPPVGGGRKPFVNPEGPVWPGYQGDYPPQPPSQLELYGPEFERNQWLRQKSQEMMMRKYGEGGGDLRKGRSPGTFDFGEGWEFQTPW